MTMRNWILALGAGLLLACAAGCNDDPGGSDDAGAVSCVAPATADDRVSCSDEVPCCEGYSCTGGTCTGCPSATQPCIEGPGSDIDAGM